ncbi:MAG: ABC transporter permease [Desulfohalobiaceae bacterium]|nr:ABC transporter permease [Desulfohalobiaceae bacterium]
MPARFLTRAALPCLLLALWQALALWIDSPTVLPGVEAVAQVLAHPFQPILITGSLIYNLLVSLLRVICGFVLAAALAVPLGLLLGMSPRTERLFESLIELLRPVPPLAWVPLLLTWFGLAGPAEYLPLPREWAVLESLKFSMIAVITIGAFFPILLNTIQGVRNQPRICIESARTLGARRTTLLAKVILPGSLPFLMTGLRIGMGIGWMCLVAAEMLPGSSSGLGYLVWYAYELMHTEIILAGILIIGMVGLLLDQGFRFLETRLCPPTTRI